METTSDNDSKEDATEENKTPSDSRIEEPEEQGPQELTEEPQEESEEPAGDSDREEQGEEAARESHQSDREPEENVETADEVPEMDGGRISRSRERSIGKSDSAMKVSQKSQESAKSSPEISGRNARGALGSRAKMVVGDVIDIRRSSMAGDVSDKKTSRYMNSYVLTSENPYNPEKVIKVLRAVMEEAMVNLPYDPHSCVKQAKWASSAIRSKVKQLNFDRYKIVSVVTIGEKHSQDFYSTCRFLWDTEKDRYTSYAIENTHVFGVGLCFGMYYE